MIYDEDVYTLINQYGASYGVKNRYLDVVAAIEELGKEVEAGSTDNINEFTMSVNMISNVGECLFALLSLCEETQIDPDKALAIATNRFEIMHSKRGKIDTAKLFQRIQRSDEVKKGIIENNKE